MSVSVPKLAVVSLHRVMTRLMALAAISLTTCGVELVSTASADDVPSIVFLKQWGQRGSEPGQFDFPIDIAINKSDEIFVTDHLNFRIQKFNTNGKLLGHFEVLPNPGGIALDAKGNLQLTHIHASANSNSDEKDFVSVYSPTGKLLRRWGKSGTGEGEFDCPGGLAADQRGRVYVADQTNHRVQVFDGEGKFLFQWGEYGNETGQFGGKASKNSRVGGPQFVKFDSDGNIWTTEGANCRVQKFTPNGKFLAAWGSADDRPGGFGGYFTGFKNIKATGLVGPIALCFDAQGHLWISTVSGRVQQFAKDGEFLRGVGNEQGTEPGQFYAPHGIAFDSAGRLYIVDAYNHRIQKFDVGHQVEQKNR